MFSSPIRTDQITATKVKDEITIFKFTSRTQTGRYALALRLIQAANQVTSWGPESAATFIGTVSGLIWPDVIGLLRTSSEVTVQVQAVPGFVADQFTSVVWDDTDPTTAPTHRSQRSLAPVDTLIFGALTPDDTVDEVTDEVIGGLWGIYMWTMGKNVTANNITGFQVNRQLAIRRKYNLSDAQATLMEGQFAPTLDVLMAIKTAWTIFNGLRHTLAREWIEWIHSNTTRSGNAFITTFRFINGAGFQGPTLIAQLLSAYPIADEFPQLRGEIKSFRKARDTFLKSDSSIRGYYKVLYGDQYDLFKAASRGPLLALAVMFARSTQPTAGRFLPDLHRYESFAQSFNEFLKQRGQVEIPTVGKAEPEGEGTEETPVAE
jgi:hypothetical protein